MTVIVTKTDFYISTHTPEAAFEVSGGEVSFIFIQSHTVPLTT